MTKTAFTGCTLIDGRGGPAAPDTTVVIDGDRIVGVGTRGAVAVPPDAQVVDLEGRSLLPGLVDAHLHLCFYYKRPDVGLNDQSTYNSARVALVASWHMQQLLDAESH